MANIEQKIDHDSLLESGYKPLRVLAEKYGYAKDHIGWLARTGRIEAVRYGNRGEWYALEESIADHKKEKVGRFESVSSIDKSSSQPKSSEVLFSVPSNKSSYSAKPTLTEVSEELRRSNPSNFSQEKLGRVNAIPRFLLILAGGILVLINFVPAIDFNKTPLAKYYSKFEDSFIEPTKNKSASLIDNVSNNISADILSPIRNFVAKYLLPEYTYETYLVVDLETRDKRQATRDRELESRIRELENLVSSTRSSSDGPSRIIKQVTTPNGYILTQLEQRVDNISSLMETTRVNLSNLSSDFSSFQRITPTTLILPPTNTKGIGPITLNPDKLSSNTLTVSGSSTLNSLTVDTTLSVTNDLTVDTNVFRVDTSNNRVGINTASPAVSLDVVGSASFTQQLKLTKAPTAAHSGTWPSFTNTSDSSLYINPSSPTADSNIIAYVNNTSPKFLVDAEGDIYGASLILTGTTTTGTTTTQGDLTVEGNTTLGDSSTDKVKFRGTILPYSLSSIPFSVKASQSQTVDIFRVLDPSDKILLTIDQGYGLLYASGGFNFGGGGSGIS